MEIRYRVIVVFAYVTREGAQAARITILEFLESVEVFIQSFGTGLLLVDRLELEDFLLLSGLTP